MNIKQNKINNIDCLQIKGVFFLLRMKLLTFTDKPSQNVQTEEDHFALKQHFAIKCRVCSPWTLKHHQLLPPLFKSSNEFSPPCWNNLYD